jgi:hypothetical protein
MYILATTRLPGRQSGRGGVPDVRKIDINDVSAQNKLMSDGAASSEDI